MLRKIQSFCNLRVSLASANFGAAQKKSSLQKFEVIHVYINIQYAPYVQYTITGCNEEVAKSSKILARVM